MTNPTRTPAIPAPPPQRPGVPAPMPRARVDGVDVARAVAIIGMVAIHVGPLFGGQLREGQYVGWLSWMAYGRASTLFALVAGVGITLGSRRGSFGENAARLLWRAAWLAPVGVFLELLGTPVAVILHYYALWFVLAIPFLRAPTWLLGTAAAVGYVVGPTILVRAQVANPEWYAPPGTGAWSGTLGDVLLTGYYPTVSWIWVVLLGMLLGRLDLGSRRVAAALLGVGTVVAAGGYRLTAVVDAAVDLRAYDAWFSTIGHADTPPEMVAVSGVAVAVLGLCLLLADLLRPLLEPIARLGRLALTVYVGHIVVYAVAREAMIARTPDEIVSITFTVTAVSTVLAVVWLAVFPRGPLESLDRGGWVHIVRPLLPGVGPDPGQPGARTTPRPVDHGRR